MGIDQKRLLKLAFELAEAKGKYADDRTLFSADYRVLRDLVRQIADEIIAIAMNEPAPTPAVDESNENIVDFDRYTANQVPA